MIACGRRVRDGYYACAHIVRKCGDRLSLAALQKLNESTVRSSISSRANTRSSRSMCESLTRVRTAI